MIRPSIHIPVFGKADERGGGANRSQQIIEQMMDLDVETVLIRSSRRVLLWDCISQPLLAMCFFPGVLSLFFRGLSLRGCVDYFFYGVRLQKLIRKRKAQKVYLESAPGLSLLLMQSLRVSKVSYEVFPHNIEFLVPGQTDDFFRSRRGVYEIEVAGYKAADRVHCISEFDSVVLQSIGIRASCFPYFPAGARGAALEKINVARTMSTATAERYLVLGTIGNPPTYQGMMALLETFREVESDAVFVIVGFGTETLSQHAGRNVQVLGGISDEALAHQMEICKGAIVNQIQTSGYLTRLIDLNLAGVPVYVLSDYVQASHLEKYSIYKVDSIAEIIDSSTRSGLNSEKFRKPQISSLVKNQPAEITAFFEGR